MAHNKHGIPPMIPAGGDPGRLPGKNILPACNNTLVAWTPEAAGSASHADLVVISSNPADTAWIAQKCGADLVCCREDISSDDAPSAAALLHALHRIRRAEALLSERMRSSTLEALPVRIDALVLDFDGVFTDNNVIVFQDGTEAVSCNRSDGMALTHLKSTGIRLLVLSSESNPVVAARCSKLDIECIHGETDKLQALQKWLQANELSLEHTVYLGNDINDVFCLRAAGCGVAVADASDVAKRESDIVLTRPGGRGAIRELVDLIETKTQQQGGNHVQNHQYRIAVGG